MISNTLLRRLTRHHAALRTQAVIDVLWLGATDVPCPPLAMAVSRDSLVAHATRLLACAFFSAYRRLFSLLVLPLKPRERVHSSASLPALLDDAGAGADDRPGVSFGGCGMLYPYQLGAAEYISEAFDTHDVRAAGHSAGFAAALCLSAGVPLFLHWDVLCAARRRWRSRWLSFVGDSEEAWMAPYMCALAPHERAVCAAAEDGRLCLGHTRIRLRARRWPPLRAGHAVTCSFDSLRTFVHAVTVSQRCPPFYRAPGYIHGAWGLDGAFSAQFTVPPGCAQERLLTVSPTNPLADISPATPLPPAWFCTLPDATRWETLRRMGYEDARAARGVIQRRGLRLRTQPQVAAAEGAPAEQ